MSDWNQFIDRGLAEDLGLEEMRLWLALGRNLLGYRRRADRLGEMLLREASGLHGRSFERARRGLVERGMLRFESGGGGRGRRSLYELLLDGETPAEERAYVAGETPAKTPANTPARGRGRSEQGARKSATTSEPPGSGLAQEASEVASRILAIFNEEAGTDFRDGGYVRMIAERVMERPDVTLEGHRSLIRANLQRPWWKGDAAPNVLYRSARAFERALNRPADGFDQYN